MNSRFQIRRCVVDDLPALLPLWRSMGFPALELEKRFSEFQVALDGEGTLLGAIGFTIVGQHGWIRHEAFFDFGLAEELRGLFWQRLHTLAANHGLHRIWTRETSHTWRELDFTPANQVALEKLPADWTKDEDKNPWLTLALPAEAAMHKLAETGNVESLMEMHRAETERTLARVKLLHNAALGLALLLGFFVCAVVGYLLWREPGLIRSFFKPR